MRRPTRAGRTAYHHGDLRNALLEAAVRLVAKQGPDGFSLREAAREVGVSPAAAYRHFPDRFHLLAAMAMEAHGRLAAAMEKALQRVEGAPGTKEHAVQALYAIGVAYVDFAGRHPEHFKVMFSAVYELEGFEPNPGPSGRDAFQILLDTLDGLVAAGVITAERRRGAELQAWAGVHGLSTLLVSCALPLPARARPLAVLTLFRGLALGMGVPAELIPPGPALSVDPRELATGG